MNKTKKGKLKKIAVFCAAVMLALVSVFATLATQKEEIRASAEDVVYASENLFEASNVGSEDMIVDGGSISIKSTDGMYFSAHAQLKDLCPRITPGTYTFSCTISCSGDTPTKTGAQYGIIIAYPLKYIISNGKLGFVSTTVTLTASDIDLGVSFYAQEGATIRWSNITCNKGSTAYPYQPPKSYYYNQGYQDASDTLNLGVLKGAKISATFTYDKGTKTITDEDPTFTYNGIDLSVYATKYYEYTPGNDSNALVSANVTITFADPFVYASFPVGFVGSSASDVYGGKFIGTDGKQYACQRDVSSSGSAFKIDEGKYPENLQVRSLVLGFGRASDTLQGVVMVQSGQYQNGYTNGYNDGFADNDSYSKGYVAGRDFGYNNGYNAGLAEGSAENGFAGLLFAVIDTPVKAFSSLLDFEILGVNMKSFVLSVLTLALFVVVVRWLLGKA